MTRKTKTQRINLRGIQAPKLKQAWLLADDHKNLPNLAQVLKAAHPSTEFRSIPAVIHFCLEFTRKGLGIETAEETQGA